MSRPPKDLFFILMLIIVLSCEPELSMCASLIVPNRGNNVLAKSFVMLWGGGAEPLSEMIGLKGISGLCVLGRL